MGNPKGMSEWDYFCMCLYIVFCFLFFSKVNFSFVKGDLLFLLLSHRVMLLNRKMKKGFPRHICIWTLYNDLSLFIVMLVCKNLYSTGRAWYSWSCWCQRDCGYSSKSNFILIPCLSISETVCSTLK